MRMLLACVLSTALAGGAAHAGQASTADALRAENEKLRADLAKLVELKARIQAEIDKKGPYLLVNKYRAADGLGTC